MRLPWSLCLFRLGVFGKGKRRSTCIRHLVVECVHHVERVTQFLRVQAVRLAQVVGLAEIGRPFLVMFLHTIVGRDPCGLCLIYGC